MVDSWQRLRLANWLDQFPNEVARRTTPLRAFTGVAALTVATVITLVLAAGGLAGSANQGTMLTRSMVEPDAQDAQPAAPESQLRELPRPMAAAPLLSPAPPQAPPPPAPPPENPGPPPEGVVGWAILDRSTGAITGSEPLAATSTTASMIKVWLVADYLRRTAEAGEEPSDERLAELTLIVRDSDNQHAQVLFEELGRHASIERLISTCGLTDSSVVPNFWSNTRLSARDTARMAACIADGRAIGDGQWTDWLLNEMRLVRGIGDFGIRHALPGSVRSSVAIKNGWVTRTDEGAWHVSCLAVAGSWSMGVLTQYPAELGYEHGAELCRATAEEHLLPRLG